MEKYINETQGLLNLIQATISENELERSTQAGMEMWDEIRKICDKHKLNNQEMANAALAIHVTIMGAFNEQIIKQKKEMGIYEN